MTVKKTLVSARCGARLRSRRAGESGRTDQITADDRVHQMRDDIGIQLGSVGVLHVSLCIGSADRYAGGFAMPVNERLFSASARRGPTGRAALSGPPWRRRTKSDFARRQLLHIY